MKAPNRIEYKSGDSLGNCIYIKEDIQGYKNSRKAVFECVCGNTFIALIANVKNEHTTSCGCLKIPAVKKSSTRHGMRQSSEYNIWRLMIARCYKPQSTSYKNYGAKGITVGDRWKKSFINFYADMGNRPEGTSLDRLENDKGYYKENCQWGTSLQQNRNRSITVKVTYNGETKAIMEWSQIYGIPYDTLKYRVRSNRYSLDECFKTPVGQLINK